MSDIGPIESGWWHWRQLLWKMGAMSLAKVTGGEAAACSAAGWATATEKRMAPLRTRNPTWGRRTQGTDIRHLAPEILRLKDLIVNWRIRGVVWSFRPLSSIRIAP
jgi:hypothetical protein